MTPSDAADPTKDGGPAAVLPRRPPPAPPSEAEEAAFVRVDGVDDAALEQLFREADADGDGRVADEEARVFFLRSGLPPQDLSAIWRLVKPSVAVVQQGKGLSRRRFSQALRLVALVQSGEPLTNQAAAAALQPEGWASVHGAPLPAPSLAVSHSSQPLSSGNPFASPSNSPELQAGSEQDSAPLGPEVTGLEFLGIEHQPRPATEDDDDDIFGLAKLRVASDAEVAASSTPAAGPAPSVGPSPSRSFSRSKAMSIAIRDLGSLGRTPSALSMDPPLAYELRFPPLNPKVSAKLVSLAAGNGSLFAAPAVNGGVLQWGRPEGDAVDPSTSHKPRRWSKLGRLNSEMMYTDTMQQGVPSEDDDAAPAHEGPPSRDPGKPSSCLLVDEPRGLLWIGDRDGWVTAYDIAGQPGGPLQAGRKTHAWQAHRIGAITALCIGLSGELWTGSSRGTLRVWQPGRPAVAGEDMAMPSRARELRRGVGEKPHSAAVLQVVLSSDGQLVWSASARTVVLWDALSGICMGVLLRNGSAGGGGDSGSKSSIKSSAGSAAELAGSGMYAEGAGVGGTRISTAKGLDVDALTGALLLRPVAAERTKARLQQEGWAWQSEKAVNELAERLSESGRQVVQNAGKAVKLMGKIAARLTNSSSAGPPSSASFGERGPPSHSSSMAEDESVYSASAGTGSESSGDVAAMAAAPDGHIWLAFRRGRLERYTFCGQLVAARELGGRPSCVATVGCRLWVGFTNGMLVVVAADASPLKVFPAHEAGIISIAQAGSRTYTLAVDGSVNGWSSAVPDAMDAEALAAWHAGQAHTFARQSIRMLCVTWNCGESRPDASSAFFRWMKEHAGDKSLVAMALQEVEMGSASVALAAARDALAYKLQEKGNANAQFWSAALLRALGGDRHWHQVGLRQLSGMLVMVFARNNLKGQLGEVATASVACGVLGVGGNKGAVAIEFTLHRRKFAVVCSHFAAHQHAVEARNANYAAILRHLSFVKRGWLDEEEEERALAGISGATAAALGTRKHSIMLPDDDLADLEFVDAEERENDDVSASSVYSGGAPSAAGVAACEDLVQGDGMRSAAALVWMGDFNYRIDGQYDQVKELAVSRQLEPLLKCDQCKREVAAGRVFRGLREPPLAFPPTYKFDKGVASAAAYDSSEKKRVPAWCDRIFFRGSTPYPSPEPTPEEAADQLPGPEDVVVKAAEYGSWEDVYDSDHRPVFACLDISLPVTDYGKKRTVCADLLQRHAPPALAATSPVQVALSPSTARLHPTHVPQQMLLLANTGPAPALFTIVPDTVTASAAGAVEVRPVRGVVQPGGEAQIHVRAAPDDGQDAVSYSSSDTQLRFQLLAAPEFGGGGESTDPRRVELEFHAVVLPEFAYEDRF